MFNRAQFEMMTTLQYDNKALKHRVKKLESGEELVSIKALHKKELAAKDRKIRALETALAEANAAIVTNRENWMQVFDDVEKEHTKAVAALERRIKKMFERAIKSEGKTDKLLDEKREILRELYATKVALDEENEKRKRLVVQLKKDHENSSIPSSQKPFRKKIANSREKTGLKQGAQFGHKGYRRKRHDTAKIIELAAPEYEGNPDYAPTGKIIKKQVVELVLGIEVVEYWAKEYRQKSQNRNRVHAEFPAGVVNEVNYGGTVKALAFMLNNNCNVSIDKTKELISEMTNGQLEISRGLINGLAKEFSKKSQREQSEINAKLICADVMGVDFTGAKVNGKQAQVLVCANEDVHMFFAKEHKGHEGIKGTPAEHTQSTLIHDHDVTFYSYGKLHQECLVHILRYLISSIENEKNRTWNVLMWNLIREMIHYMNGLAPDEEPDSKEVKRLEAEYWAVLKKAEEEYEYEPANKYYKDGYNLYRRLEKYSDSHLLFLHDKRVPSNNNLCERLLRKLRRKMRAVMTFRSFESLENFCSCLGMLGVLRLSNDNVYSKVAEIFG